jgi:hypothetical protein
LPVRAEIDYISPIQRMARPTKSQAEAARRLLDLAGLRAGEPDPQATAAAGIYDTLEQALGPVIGQASVRALFLRSVRLNSAEFPSFTEISSAISVSDGGESVAHRVSGSLRKLDPTEATRAATSLYTTMYALISNLIGEELVWQIIKGAFPALDETGSEDKE